MKFLVLIWAGLFRKPVRSLLTLASIIVAFLLFGMLQSVSVSFEEGGLLSGANRLVVAPKYSIIDDIPLRYRQQIQAVEGVELVNHLSWFGGTYVDQTNFFPRWPTDPAVFFDIFTEYTMPEDQIRNFKEVRTSAIVGREIANQFGLKVGDKVPIIPDIWPNKDNSTWEFDLVGIYDATDDSANLSQMYINFDFFDEYRTFGSGSVGQFVITIDDPERSADIAAQIDAMFANSSDETKTQTEKAYNQMFANQMGNIALIMTGILSAVFFTILLLTGNTMSQAIRERIPELAILKTVGFNNVSVLMIVLGESILMILVGCVLGLGLAGIIIPGIPASVPFLGDTQLSPFVIVQGVVLAVVVGVIVGLPPALKAMKLNIVDALSEHA